MATIHNLPFNGLHAFDEADRIIAALRAVPDLALAGVSRNDEDMTSVKIDHFIPLMEVLIEKLEIALEAARRQK